MADPRPLRTALVLQTVGLAALGLWWLHLPFPERVARLTRLAWHEQASALPPTGLLAQVDWLTHHRLARLSGMLGLLVVAVLIGSAQGLATRRRDVRAGFRLTAWTIGLLGGAVLPGLVAGYVLVPVVLVAWWVGVGLAGVLGVVGYLVCWGRPSVP